ncbi:MAG: hypothetical protein LBI18_12760 [Planctomycetaceae bacterium]|jgi:hypothetical protein|nr:hypothetical protein [Planctomycetaceae bacterium]
MTNEVFQIICSLCGSKLNAKISLIGQTRNCPKCHEPILIQRNVLPEPTTLITTNEPSIVPVQTGLVLGNGTHRIENLPKQLESRYRYLIVGVDRIIALWETGKGWQVNVGNGFASAKRNFSAIPDQGTFVLVELVIDSAGVPTGLNVFTISVRGALTSLFRDESEILHKVDGNGTLTKNQKNLLLNYLRQNFMYEIFAESRDLVALLSES